MVTLQFTVTLPLGVTSSAKQVFNG